MALRELTDVAEIDLINSSYSTETERIKALCEVFLVLPAHRASLIPNDPFSIAYQNHMKEWLAEITMRPGYDPAKHELAPYLEEQVAAETVLPSMYRYGDGTMLGEMLQAIGATIKALDVRSGQSVLEYGAGDGAISLNLARMGCRVTAVDIENRYLKLIQAQALAFGTSVHTINAPFGSAEPDYQYDRILFFEAFHHALAHQELLRSLRRQLAPGGFIVFAGEPILPTGSYFRPTLPYPWGPRLDGLSVRAMRSYGWCELGFTREYFVDWLMRSGFAVTYRPDPSTERGSAYLATRTGRIVDLGGPHLLETAHFPDCWHPGEGKIRWSRSRTAGIPIDGVSGWRKVTLHVHNFFPVEKRFSLRLGAAHEHGNLAPGQSAAIETPVTSDCGSLEITCELHRPSDLDAGNSDDRHLGIAVSELQYTA